jgi:hypothetical protein
MTAGSVLGLLAGWPVVGLQMRKALAKAYFSSLQSRRDILLTGRQIAQSLGSFPILFLGMNVLLVVSAFFSADSFGSIFCLK